MTAFQGKTGLCTKKPHFALDPWPRSPTQGDLAVASETLPVLRVPTRCPTQSGEVTHWPVYSSRCLTWMLPRVRTSTRILEPLWLFGAITDKR